jgi:hypothetical protein
MVDVVIVMLEFVVFIISIFAQIDFSNKKKKKIANLSIDPCQAPHSTRTLSTCHMSTNAHTFRQQICLRSLQFCLVVWFISLAKILFFKLNFAGTKRETRRAKKK